MYRVISLLHVQDDFIATCTGWLLWYCYEVNQANYRFDTETFGILVRIIPYNLGLELEAML